MWGVYAVRGPGAGGTAGIDLYYLGYRRNEASFDQGTPPSRAEPAKIVFERHVRRGGVQGMVPAILSWFSVNWSPSHARNEPNVGRGTPVSTEAEQFVQAGKRFPGHEGASVFGGAKRRFTVRPRSLRLGG